MSRREFPKTVRLAAWNRCGGFCEGCGAPLLPGRLQYDHITPDAVGGEPTLENRQVLCSGGRATCHGAKTAERDVPLAAKTKRQREKSLGIRAPKRRIGDPRLIRKVSGEVVWR